jgi:ferritin
MIKPVKLEQEIVDLLLPRLKMELTHFYFYRAASNWCQGVGYFKAAEYFAKESEEESGHAKEIEKYLTDWNVFPALPTIDEPIIMFSGLPNLIEAAYNTEYDLYTQYEEASMQIFDIGDLCTFDFLQVYRKRQKDAVATLSDMINLLEGVNENSKFELLMLEEKLF